MMLILNAKSIGTGKRATSEYTDVTNVFFSTRANWYELIKFLKCFNPTHGLPHTHFAASKSLNAICSPIIGP